MSYPVSMKCTTCATEAVVEVPDTLMPVIDDLQFICGDCGREKA